MSRPLDGDCEIKILKCNGNKDINGGEDDEADKLGVSLNQPPPH